MSDNLLPTEMLAVIRDAAEAVHFAGCDIEIPERQEQAAMERQQIQITTGTAGLRPHTP